ncbi:MAG: V-type ATP synthase subunit D [Spirochaetales bacterium]|nr:V-type ATP synthase subunit D [Spirochaetales bacterium]
MAKIKLSKTELKKQKDALKRFLRYLPTLVLKKQQLQMEMRKIEALLEKKQELYTDKNQALLKWIAVFGEPVELEKLVAVKNVETETNNVAGIDIPVFIRADFEQIRYDLFTQPLWVDKAVEAVKELSVLKLELDILHFQKLLLGEELRITSQRINLFEKVKIPDTRENIRVIQIYLGDQQIAAVVRGKISKNKIMRSLVS